MNLAQTSLNIKNKLDHYVDYVMGRKEQVSEVICVCNSDICHVY